MTKKLYILLRLPAVLLCALLISILPACQKQKCPAYMTQAEITEAHKQLIKQKIKSVKKDKKGLVKKKNPRL